MVKKLMLAIASIAAAFGSWAETETVGGYTWTYSINGDNTVTICRNNYAYSAAISPKPTGAVTIPATLGGKPVTSIGYNAFYGCSGLTSVTIPDSVTSIGNGAFDGCSGLTSVHITDLAKWCGISFYGYGYDDNPLYYAHNLYLNGEKMTNLVIPDSVTTIGRCAFYGCSGLTSVTIPDSVTSIESYAFYGCSGLSSVTIPNSVTSIGTSAFYGCSGLTSVTIPDSVTSIGGWAFNRCSGLTSVTIPNSVTSIEIFAFYGCSGLTSVTIGDGVTSIGDDAFSKCSSLTSVTIPQLVCTNRLSSVFSPCQSISNVVISAGVTSIGPCAFENCYGLASVSIPDSVTNIGYKAFCNCNGLVGVTIGNGVTSIGRETFRDCSGLASVTMPNGVTAIGDSAFENCTSLASVSIPDSVTYIGYRVFCNCNSLVDVIIGNGVTSIKSSAFSGCSRLTSVTIGDGVTSIGDDAFSKCSSLTSVTIPQYVCAKSLSSVFPDSYQSITNILFSDSVTWIGYNAFSGCSDLSSVIIPDSITRIEQYAFNNCSSLTSVTIPDSVTSVGYYAFNGCSSLASVTIPQCVCAISLASVFSSYGAITNVVISDSVTSIGDYAFSSCNGLMNVTIPGSVTSIGSYSFSECSNLASVTIPDSVTSVGEKSFAGCGMLTMVDIPRGLKSIGAGAFDDCWRLRHVNFASIEDYLDLSSYEAFAPNGSNSLCVAVGGTAVTDLVIPYGVTDIADYEFSGFKELESVRLPVSVTNFSSKAFDGCTKIKSVTLPTLGSDKLFDFDSGNWIVVDTNVYQSNAISHGRSTSMKATAVEGENIKFRWKVSSESGCDLLRFYIDNSLAASISGVVSSWQTVSKTLVPGVHELRWTYSKDASVSSGYDCGWVEFSPLCIVGGGVGLRKGFADSLARIEQVTLLEGATEIPDGSFAGCVALTDLRIPSTVTNIGTMAFADCESLSTIRVGGDNWMNLAARVPRAQLVELRVDYPVGMLSDGFFDGCTDLERIVLPVEATSLQFAHDFFGEDTVSLGILRNGSRIATGDGAGRVSWIIPENQRMGTVLQLVGYDGAGHILPRKVTIEYAQISARPDVMISPQSDSIFESSQKVVISSSWPNAVIHYTTDGSEPTQTSPVFKKFNVTGKTTVKAIAIAEGYPPSEVVSATYGTGRSMPPVLTCSASDWTFYDGSVDVTMACETEGAQIRYTLDGSVPTEDSALYAGPISISRTTTVRAIACSHPTLVDSDVATRTVLQRLPVVANPVISCAMAAEESGQWRTWQSGNLVTISCATPGAEIHYTTNGVSPDASSPIYTGPISTDESLTIKAIAYAGDGYLESDAVTRTLVRGWRKVSRPEISSGSAEPREYYVNQVAITCETEGATIYYTTDGSDPSLDGMIYSYPFRVNEQTTIRAMARKFDCIDSESATLTVPKTWIDGTVAGYSGVFMSTSAVPWTVDSQFGHSGGTSFRSGDIADGTSDSPTATVLTMASEGSGFVKFWWKASCEDDPDFDDWDHAVFTVDGVEKSRIDGATDWVQVYVELDGEQVHLLAWSYYKDDSGSDFDDCVWVDDVELVTSATEFGVSFEDSAASGTVLPAPFSARVGSAFILPSASAMRKGYVFDGWFYSGDIYKPGDEFTMPPSDVTFSVAWRPIGYIIAYDANGGDGIIPSTYAFYDEFATVASNEFTRAFYKFAGWSTESDGEVLYSDGERVVNLAETDGAVVTFYAVWDTMSLAEMLDCDELYSVSTTGDAFWTPVGGEQAYVGGSCLVSGSPVEGDEVGRFSALEAKVLGAGMLTFWWKVSCEADRRGTFTYDYAAFEVDGVVVARIDGDKGWSQVSHTFSSDGEHIIRWIYNSDGWSAEGYSDCAWVDGVVWTSSGGVVVDAGDGKTVTVSQTWLAENTTRAATDVAANGRKVWECYVLGLDPEDAESDFKITSFPLKADGTPDLENLGIAPEQSKWNVEGAHPIIKGKATLDGAGEWQTVTDENKAEMRFFRVEVQLP